jgi:RNA polymerase sigma-70 factor, ECF subfamily
MTPWASSELISRARAGEGAAIDELIAAIWPRCFRLAASVLGDSALAQDAAQEACAIVYRKVRNLRDAAAFDAWMYRLTVREASRIRHRHAIAADLSADPAASDADATALDVWRALAQLTPQLREVTVLFYFDDLKSEEIAPILHVAHATVRTRLSRARGRLREILGDYADVPASTPDEVQHDAV